MKFSLALVHGQSLLTDCFRQVCKDESRLAWRWTAKTSAELVEQIDGACPDAIVVLADVDSEEVRRVGDAAGESWPDASTVLVTDRPLSQRDALREGFSACVDLAAGLEHIKDTLIRSIKRPSAAPDDTSAELSERERQVVVLLSRGHTARETADHLGLSPRGIDACRRRVQARLRLPSLAAMTKYCIAQRLIDVEEGASLRERCLLPVGAAEPPLN